MGRSQGRLRVMDVPCRLFGWHGMVFLLALIAQAVGDAPDVSMMQDDDILSGFDNTVANIEKDAGFKEAAMLGESDDDAPNVDQLVGKISTTKNGGPIIPRSSKMFSRIPNMVFPGVVENVKNKEECMEHCINRGECRSYSYRNNGNKCFWSKGQLRYSHQWDFYTKEFDTNEFGQLKQTNEFFKFSGLYSVDTEGNMQTHREQSVDDCKERCNSDKKCLSFSYHDLDKVCLMGRAKVRYSKGWDYYERNQRPKKKGHPWLPYPFELDSYTLKLRKEQEDALKLLVDQEKKKRISKQKKEDVVKTTMKYMETKQKRLDKEMKMKAYAREQSKKKMAAIKKKRKVDADAATEKGKFDEAFHKQKIRNAGLLRKRRKEKAVKLNFMRQLNEKQQELTNKMQARLAAEKIQERNKMLEAQRVIKQKEKQQKKNMKIEAAGMKVSAFKLVKEERKFKSSTKHDARLSVVKKNADREKRKQWAKLDEKGKINNKEKNLKRKVKIEKDRQALKLKLAKEKLGKAPKRSDLPGENSRTKVPRKPKPLKSKKLPKSAPGTKKPKFDVPKKPKSS